MYTTGVLVLILTSVRASLGTKELRHLHEGWEIVVIHEGAAIIGGESWRHVLTPGDAVLFHAGSLHGARAIGRQYVRTAIHFLPHAVDDDVAQALMRHSNRPLFGTLGESGDPAAAKLLRRLIDIAQEPGAAREATALMRELLSRNLHETLHPQSPSLPQPLVNVMRYMVTSVHERASIGDLADRAYVSEGHLRRLFMTHVGCSAQKFWLRLKVEHACDLLLRGATADEAGAATGFESRSGFIRAFRRITGLSPSSYRSAVKAGYRFPKPFRPHII